MEIWRDIKGFEGYYQISNLGRVKSLSRFQSKKERILKQYFNKRGYVRYRLSINNKPIAFFAHRLVAIAFIPNPNNKPHINHIDGNPSNNNINNIEWCTPSENMKHAFRIGLQSLDGEKNTQSKLTEHQVRDIKGMLFCGFYHKTIAKIYNVSRRCITDINKNKTWVNVKCYQEQLHIIG